MKQTILAISILLSIPSSTMALSMEQCTEYAGLAEAVMEARQTGVSPIKLMKALKEVPLGEEMLKQAYEQPSYQTSGYKERAIRVFRDEWYVNCLRAMDHKKGN